MPKEDFPPPEGMSEEKYVELLMTEHGCQICKRIKECKIYWESEIRCCIICFYEKTVSWIELIMKIKYPLEFVNIMPCTHTGYFLCKKYYWKEQVDLAYTQYYGLSKKKKKKNWLENKKQEFDSIMNYVRQRELRKSREKYFQEFFLYPHTYCDIIEDDISYLYSHYLRTPLSPPLPPLSRFFIQDATKEVKKVEKIEKVNNNDIPQLIQLYIKRLENESQQSTFNIRKKLNNCLENSNERKKDNFIKIKNKKDKRELNYKFNMKMRGKDFKNKFAYIYG
ncbi:hypothetical protein RclHR1_08910006 [Rhizophagus clarus]|nr:hypothetical protein RclHR1_08910006 [Rhizophagus clarus]